MARKKQKADPISEFREKVVDSIARIETNLSTLLQRQSEDRAALQRALEEHMERDTAHFESLYDKQAKTERLMNRGVGGVIVLQVVLGLLVAMGVLQF